MFVSDTVLVSFQIISNGITQLNQVKTVYCIVSSKSTQCKLTIFQFSHVIVMFVVFRYTGKFIGNRYGTGLGQIWLDDVICNGTERSIAQCEHRTWGLHDCTRGELVSIKCG